MKSLIVLCLVAIGLSAAVAAGAMPMRRWAGQLSVWFLGLRYDLVREWTIGPILLAAIALSSIPVGFGAFRSFPALTWTASSTA